MAANQGMNMMEMIKLKVMMSVGGDNASENNGIYTLMIMFIIGLIEQNFHIIWNTVQKKIENKYQAVVSKMVESTNDKFSIFLEKDLSKENNDNKDNLILESILHNISEKYNIKSVMYFKNLYVVNFFEQFNIEENIYAKLHRLEYDNEFKISQIKIQISSDVLTVSELRKYIERCYSTFKRKIQNNLGSELYFFDQKCTDSHKNMDGIETYPPFLKFEYNKFSSNRNFTNIFGENIQVLKNRVTFFKNNKKWYDNKGIPYTFGALLHGIPGSGKTSIIKSIANECNRHIVNINLAEVKTNTQLKNLFYNKNIHCQSEFQDINFDIEIEEKLFIIEDIDCMSQVVLERSSNIEDLGTNIEDINIEEIEEIITCKDCKLGHHETHCYSVLKKFCPHCKNLNKIVNKCQSCKDPFKHCTIDGHCENFLKVENPRRCCKCLDSFESKENKKLDAKIKSSNNGNLADFNPTSNSNKKQENDLITLSSLLNILDGTLELPGRMIIITSNFPEKLDKALIRPGRIDIILNLDKASTNTIKEIYESFYSTKISPKSLLLLKDVDKVFTPAEVNCIFFNNFDTPELGLKTILESNPKALGSF
jgi:hypothetical protein